jgi:uncharacterized protein (DUF849 family)
MQDNSVADALRALATNSKGRSEMARLREIIDDIEAALSAGASRADIHKTLLQHGYKLTEKGFATALYRIRKKRKVLAHQTTTQKASSYTPNNDKEGENNAINTDEYSVLAGLKNRGISVKKYGAE